MRDSNFPLFLTCIFLFMWMLCSQSTFVVAQGPGYACKNDSDCLPSNRYMTCVPTDNPVVSECQCSPDTYYDYNACRVYTGTPCADDPYSCPYNGYCEPTTKTCVCSDASYIGPKCKRNYGSSCFSRYQCDSDLFLECRDDSKCGCTENAIMDNGTCKLMEGELCGASNRNQECARGSICVLDSTSNYAERRCRCNAAEGFELGASQLCYLRFGAICSEDNLCHSNLECSITTGRCACFSPMTTVYEDGDCKIAANATCSTGTNATPCTEHATCDCEIKKCLCDVESGYEATNLIQGMVCAKRMLTNGGDNEFGEKHGTICSPEDVVRCSENYGLDCFDGQCVQPSNSFVGKKEELD